MKRVESLLDTGPFVYWYDREARIHGQDAVSIRLGWKPNAAARKMYGWRVERRRCEDPLGLFDACFMGGVDMIALYDAVYRRETAPDGAFGPQQPYACRWNARWEHTRAQLLDEGEPNEVDDFVWRYPAEERERYYASLKGAA